MIGVRKVQIIHSAKMRNLIFKGLYDCLSFSSRVFGKISRLLFSFSIKWIPKNEHDNIVINSTGYNMVTASDEPYYAEQYWRLISKEFIHVPGNPFIVDLGCSQGRFTIKFAKAFPTSKIIACDLSAPAIVFAREYAANQKINNISFNQQPITQLLNSLKYNSVDIIVMTEVIFFYPEWESDLPKIVRSLKPGGLVVLSFRSQYFYAMHMARNKKLHNTDLLINEREGQIMDSALSFTWQTSKEIRNILVERHGLLINNIFGVGVCSGISGDPHDMISQPSQLSENEKKQLMELELEIGSDVPDAGRYILVIARKPIEQDSIPLAM